MLAFLRGSGEPVTAILNLSRRTLKLLHKYGFISEWQKINKEEFHHGFTKIRQKQAAADLRAVAEGRLRDPDQGREEIGRAHV